MDPFALSYLTLTLVKYLTTLDDLQHKGSLCTKLAHIHSSEISPPPTCSSMCAWMESHVVPRELEPYYPINSIGNAYIPSNDGSSINEGKTMQNPHNLL